MITVIIADNSFLQKVKSYDIFLQPLIDKSRLAFCEWNPEGESIEEMVPGLYDILEYQEEWRAVIINNDGFDKKNPFDRVDYSGASESGSLAFSDISEACRKKQAIYEKAETNPIVKLTTAFFGKAEHGPIKYDAESIEKVINGDVTLYKYMMQNLLKHSDRHKLIAKIKIGSDDNIVMTYFPKEKQDEMIECIKNGDADGVLGLINEGREEQFMNYITNNDPAYSDPNYAAYSIEGAIRTERIKNISNTYRLNDKLPKDIVCISQRIYEPFYAEIPAHDETEDIKAYTSFSNYNLYNESLKFILFDVLPDTHKQHRFSMLKYLYFVLLLAQNRAPSGSIRIDKIYSGKLDFDNDSFRSVCDTYIGKLIATEIALKEMQAEKQSRKVILDNYTVEKEFMSHVSIPVLTKAPFRIEEMKADFKGYGLSKNCPEPEDSRWNSQYKSIKKNFARYLREPRRAVDRAVLSEFNTLRRQTDDRAKFLNKYQRDDVEIHLKDEEKAMIETRISSIYDIKRYNEQLDEADKKINEEISKRMTRGSTVLTGLIPTLIFLFSFIPLVTGNLNNVLSSVISLLLSAGSVLIFILCGFLYLHILKRRLKKKFTGFNNTMAGVLSDVDSCLGSYSAYLAHACNVMRDKATLIEADRGEEAEKDTYRYHMLVIERKIHEAKLLFAQFLDQSHIKRSDTNGVPYDYNFNIIADYKYDIPSYGHGSNIEFIQAGNYLRIPVDFIKSVTLEMEELYD